MLGVGAMQRCTVAPGEAIFIPCNWYHATENLPPAGVDQLQRGEITSPTIAIAMQWSASWDAEVYPTRVDSSSGDFCPADVHADFRQLFGHVARLSSEGLSAQAAQLLEKACSYTPIFVHCTVGLSRLYTSLGKAEAARETLLAGGAVHRALHSEGVIADEVLATVLGLVAAELAGLDQEDGPGWAWVSWAALEEAAQADSEGSDPLLQIRWARALLGAPDKGLVGAARLLEPPASYDWPTRLAGAEAALVKARRSVEGQGKTAFFYQPPTTGALDSAALKKAVAKAERALKRVQGACGVLRFVSGLFALLVLVFTQYCSRFWTQLVGRCLE